MEGITVASLAADLGRLGVHEGQVVMVHASLRSIGARLGGALGGADGVIAAIERVVGPSGTILVNVGVEDPQSWVNERPEAERPALLHGSDPFDPTTTPADPDNGAFAEAFRQRPDTRVSNHPEGRFAARGVLAGALVDDVPWHHYYGSGSPLQRLVDHGGAVLRLGADIDTVTLLHYAENIASVPQKRHVRRHRMVLDARGESIVRTVDCLDDSDGIVAWSGDDYFGIILTEYLATGRARVGIVGGASSELIDAADFVDFGVRWMEQHLSPASKN